jgi:hypothetical protein
MGKPKRFTKRVIRTGFGTTKKYTKKGINAGAKGAKLVWKKIKK